jgi:WD repeat-containing protein 81
MQDFSSFVRNTLRKLYGSWPMLLEHQTDRDVISFCLQSADHKETTANVDMENHVCHSGPLIPDAVIESSAAFYVVMPFVQYTLADLLVFSPSRLTHTNKLFILYQLLHAVRRLHMQGLSIGDLQLRDVAVDDRLWIGLFPPPMSFLCCILNEEHSVGSKQDRNTAQESGIANLNRGDVTSEQRMQSTQSDDVTYQSSFDCSRCKPVDLPLVVHKWVYGELSNFDYLMFLNRLAGRSTNDPNHYPILPWTMDFSAPGDSGFRDLTRSKYRLNKGDEQLDLTYDMSNPESMMREPGQTPFHVSDFLSDITYYVYMARRTDKSVLCRLVRQRWVPAHYPASLERLYRWTPDECIPEFYTDPSIFISMHDDLPDLELPIWAKDATDFIKIHRSVLEGEVVSQSLHHWIDLTFGHKVFAVSGQRL